MPITTKIKPEELSKTFRLTEIGLGPWSHSKLKVLHKCPFQFYLKYLVKAKQLEAPAPNLQTNTGKAAHAIIEKILLGKSLTEAFSLVKKEFQDVITEEQWEEGVVTLEYNIQKFHERILEFNTRTPVKRYLQELRIGVTCDLEPTGFFAEDVWFRGVIDLALQLENGDVIFLDHKTGATAIAGLKHYKDQLNTYKVLFHHGIEKINGAQAGIHFIREGELLLGDYSPVEEIENELVNNLRYDIQCAIDKVNELGYFKHIAGSSCQWCDFKEACKSKVLLPLEKSTVELFKNQS